MDKPQRPFSADPDLCRGPNAHAPKHPPETFRPELASGKSANDAYMAAGYKSNRGNANFLRRQQSISIQITEILEERAKIDAMATQIAAEKTGVDKAWGMSRLKENVERSMQAIPITVDGVPVLCRYDGAVANRALELLGGESGMFIDKGEATHRIAVVSDKPLSPEEFARQFCDPPWPIEHQPH